ncbi:MAG: malto-oligosyltrehalose synthase [Verrucomicrobia bacterium]|nr:MAG: malto-oligosyltrehalose synthase [Verrucomicrobiota bacterium]
MSRLSLDMTNVRIPTATYRLQFNKNFTFRQAREIVAYLHHLGISDAYASPYFQAGAESLHGYDITDHNKLNAAIGSREDYDAWVAELHAHGMGQIVDFVPNHMGINDPQNTWWQDVLENGPSSLYAPYFDIDWRPLKTDLHDKVLLPILGDQYGRVLERGELQVRFDGGSFSLTYFDHVFPIAPGTYRYILELALENLAEFRDEDFYAEFQSIRTALEYLPRRTETNPGRIKERAREKEIIKKRLERRCAEAPQVQRAIEKAVETINGHVGDPRSFDRLDELLNAQSYRLAFWRVAAEEINYRRFFDVNDLAAIRVELPEVFDAAHKLLFELVASDAVSGLRIDHPDGLYRPLEYFEKLQSRCAKALRVPLPKDGRAIYLIVEKILTGDEQLPQNWPVHGTTGYDFANQVAGVLVDHNAEGAITKIFKRFISHSLHFGHLVYAKKRLVMRISLANEVNVLGNMVDRLSEQNRWFRDYTLEALARAVRETIACFPVYRTYLEPGKPVSEEDRAVIERAVAAAKRRNPAIEESVFNFLLDLLLFRFPENLDEEQRAAHAQFVLKFQQFTGPITAKGLEDTVFYIYNRLAALNEVGGEPQLFGLSVETFHQRNLRRERDWPASLLATSTHDSKRSEDVRARMLAISEIPQLWGRSLQKWRTTNRRFKKQIDEAEAPDAGEEYLLYQTLLGTWPVDLDGAPVSSVGQEFVTRIQRYMAKALKEAKLNTSWIQPNENWDDAMREFVARILEPGPRNKFLPIFLPVAAEIARLGAINSLAQTAIKLTTPGVPDIYQGTEIWDDSLVDPDNRRPIDYARRREMLAQIEKVSANELMQCWPNGRIKMRLTQRLLHLRRENPELFREGNYESLNFGGELAECAIGFARRHGDRAIIVIVPRLSSQVGFPPVGDRWQDTHVLLSSQLTGLRDVFCDRELRAENSQLRLTEAMSQLPFAVFRNW